MFVTSGDIDHNFYMALAAQAASRHLLLTHPNPAVGALLLDRNGRILAIAAHEKAGGPHAEVRVFQRSLAAALSGPDRLAFEALEDSARIHAALLAHHQNRFKGGTLYVTLEPCAATGKTPACAPLIAQLGIKQVVIGSRDPNPSMAGGIASLEGCGLTVIQGVQREACDELIAPFVAHLQGRAFRVFKWAQRLSGSIDGGQVSCAAALDEVHQLRSVVDLLAIGGQTVRTDRPTLDARRVQGRPPPVQILSNQTAFDPDIPLFCVPDRSVHISAQVSAEAGLVLIEGGPGLLEVLWDQIDRLLIYQSGHLQGGLPMAMAHEAERLFTQPMGRTLKGWYRPLR